MLSIENFDVAFELYNRDEKDILARDFGFYTDKALLTASLKL